jgi:uncharacterized protein
VNCFTGTFSRAAAAFVALLICFWLVAKEFRVPVGFSIAISFALLFAPYWAFGFGFDLWLTDNLRERVSRTLAPLLLIVPYLIFTLARGEFRWSMCLGMMGIVLAITVLLQFGNTSMPGWHDWVALAILFVAVDLHFFDRAWPAPGLTGIPKLLFVDAGLYGFLVIRKTGGIGFDFHLQRSDITIGIREFLYFAPIAILLGFATGFLHFHRTPVNPLAFGAGWLFTFFFVALPEELFFRGLMLNMLSKHMGTNRALAITSILFGLAHFNKRAAYFNWRYVILAAIAGVFYGRAWLAQRRLVASSITHATVDAVWSTWFR